MPRHCFSARADFHTHSEHLTGRLVLRRQLAHDCSLTRRRSNQAFLYSFLVQGARSRSGVELIPSAVDDAGSTSFDLVGIEARDSTESDPLLGLDEPTSIEL